MHNLFISVSAPLFNIQKFVVSKYIYKVTKGFISNKRFQKNNITIIYYFSTNSAY